ncbi:MAG: hypothetical protein R2745_25755 [Vicinamibacterales bacterium]
MNEIHHVMRDVPVLVFALMVGIPLAMTASALLVGWLARDSTRRRREESGGRRTPQDDALAAGITVAIVPLAFALLMLWGRFG